MTPDQTMDKQAVIAGEGFVLRPLRASDAGLIRLNAGDERVARMTRSVPHPLPPGATEDFIRRAQSPNRDEDVWAIDGTPSDRPEAMGLIGLTRIDTSRDSRFPPSPEGLQAEISYWVAPVWWNTGVASAAVAAMVAANPLDCRTLFGTVFQDNPASARVLTNCGFQYLGDAEVFSVARGGTLPTWTYSLALKSRKQD